MKDKQCRKWMDGCFSEKNSYAAGSIVDLKDSGSLVWALLDVTVICLCVHVVSLVISMCIVPCDVLVS